MANGRAVYARDLASPRPEAEALMTERAGPQYTTEAFNAAGGPGGKSKALTDRDRSIAVITALVSQNVTDEHLATYLGVCTAERSGRTGPYSADGAAYRLQRPTLHLAGDGDGTTDRARLKPGRVDRAVQGINLNQLDE